MSNVNGNGTVAKLTSIRQEFLSGVNDVRKQFVDQIKQLREDYITQVMDVVLKDPKLSDVEAALSSWPTPVTVVLAPPAEPPLTPLTPTPETLYPPEKQPMKAGRRARRSVYGSCPNCNSPVYEPQAKFCAQCAYPLQEP